MGLIGQHCKKLYEDAKQKISEKEAKANFARDMQNGLKERISDNIISTFGINEENKKTLLKVKFEQAVSGSGDELLKIFKPNSSSLCCLLHFYKNEIKLNKIPGIKDLVSEYTAFEFKNPVVDKDHPSNIDVVLYNETEKIIVFLESKYAEFLNFKKQGDSYAEYADFSKSYFEFNEKQKCEKELFDRANKVLEYLGVTSEKSKQNGIIKQFICHYIGVVNRLRGITGDDPNKTPNKETAGKINELINNGARVYLGIIYFEHDCLKGETEIKQYNDYLDVFSDKNNDHLTNYEALAEKLNKYPDKPDKLTVLPKPIKYSDLRRWNEGIIDDIVKKFYGCGE